MDFLVAKKELMMKNGKALIGAIGNRVDKARAKTITAPVLLLTNRAHWIESSQHAAMADNDFKAFVLRGDEFRDQGRWQEAEAGYADALRLFPYERSYWIQHGHMAKEQGKHDRAELSYRTACALGARPSDVLPHFNHVMVRQNVDHGKFPMHFYRDGSTANQVPAQPDIMLFARLFWGVRGMADEDMLSYLRRYNRCDALASAMCCDPRFERANRVWLEVVQENEL